MSYCHDDDVEEGRKIAELYYRHNSESVPKNEIKREDEKSKSNSKKKTTRKSNRHSSERQGDGKHRTGSRRHSKRHGHKKRSPSYETRASEATMRTSNARQKNQDRRQPNRSFAQQLPWDNPNEEMQTRRPAKSSPTRSSRPARSSPAKPAGSPVRPAVDTTFEGSFRYYNEDQREHPNVSNTEQTVANDQERPPGAFQVEGPDPRPRLRPQSSHIMSSANASDWPILAQAIDREEVRRILREELRNVLYEGITPIPPPFVPVDPPLVRAVPVNDVPVDSNDHDHSLDVESEENDSDTYCIRLVVILLTATAVAVAVILTLMLRPFPVNDSTP